MKNPYTLSITRIILKSSSLLLVLCFLGLYNQAVAQITTSPLERNPDRIQMVPIVLPAFIGYTEKATKDNQTLSNVPTAINSLEESFSVADGFDNPENNQGVRVGEVVFKVKYFVASPIGSMSLRFEGN
jgi:hypothetical protein